MADAQENIAAVDLGSNSFHAVVARPVDGDDLQVVDRIKDMVRLAAGLTDDNTLDEASQKRALNSLKRLGERLSGVPESNVRVVGTNTLRKARNARGFLQRAEDTLGHSIEIISGSEEARLVYLGVAHSIGRESDGRRLVVDIGGGSTELIVGEGFEPQIYDSKYMGCVGMSLEHFPGGDITAERFDEAEIVARQELQVNERKFRDFGWDLAIGASGTTRAIWKMIVKNDIDTSITLDGMRELRRIFIEEGHTDDLDLSGLSNRRKPVIPGGLAILIGVFEALGVDSMIVSDGALREGAMYDLLGRIKHHDVRDEAISAMVERYGVDRDHASRVEATAMKLLEETAPAWGLDRPAHENMLRWAARIHEIGLAISHSKYHKHGSYLVDNSDMPGFSRQDQKFLWAMVRSHRRKLKPHRFDSLPERLPTRGPRLAILLRLAVLLNRGRNDDAVPDFAARVESDDHLHIVFPQGWVDDSPLMRADLEEEADYLDRVDLTLTYE